MADGFDYDVVIRGVREAVEGLKALNKELESGKAAGVGHARRVELLNQQIEAISRSFGKSSDSAKLYFSTAVEGSTSLSEGLGRLNKAQQRIDRQTRIGKTQSEALARAFELQAADARKAAKATTEQSKAVAESNKVSKVSTKDPNAQVDAELRAAEIQKLIDADRQYNESIVREQQKSLDKIKQETEAADLESRKIREADLQNRIKNINAIESSTKKGIQNTQKEEQKLDTDSRNLNEIRINNRIKAIQDLEKSFAQAVKNTTKENETQLAIQKKAQESHNEAIRKGLQKQNEYIGKLQKQRSSIKEDQLKEDFKLAQKYLEFEQGINSGRITQRNISNLPGTQLADLNRGRDIVNATDAGKYQELAAAISRTRTALYGAAAAQTEFIGRAQQGDRAVKEFTLSWQTMGRILVAQAFNQAFFGIQNGLRNSVKEAEDLYKAVAEIQTIVEQSSRGAFAYAAALESVLLVSDRINFTPTDTAEAFYETLSNQIGDSVTEIKSFIQAAGELGKVTKSTLADSADAISSVINSYNLSVSDAADVSAKLFTLVDRARLRLDEVSNRIGNVSVPASQLGVSFDSVVGGLSAISIAGIPARETLTLLRNVMFKMIDPTEAMQELLESWGTTTANAAIATFGFEKVIEMLSIEARSGNQRIAELMGTIRGTRGVLGLSDENFRKYTEAVEASRIAHETYTKTVEEYLQNPGEQYSKLIQQISNEYVRMGLRIVDLIVKTSNFFGETDQGRLRLSLLLGLLTKTVVTLGGAAAAFLLTTTAANALSSAFYALGASAATASALSGIGIVLAVIAAAATATTLAITAFTKSSTQSFGEIKAAAAEANKELADSFREGLIESLEETNSVTAKAQKSLLDLANAMANLDKKSKSFQADKAMDNLGESLERIVKALSGGEAEQKIASLFNSVDELTRVFGSTDFEINDSLEERIDKYDREVDAIQRVIDKIDDQRNKTLDLAKANRIALATSITERNIESIQDPNQRGSAQLQASRSAAAAATQAADPEESKRLFDIARKFLADAERTAFETGAFGNIQNHTQFFNQQEAELYALQERRLAAEDRQLAIQREQRVLQGQELINRKEIAQNEIDRRKELEAQYKLEKAFLEEYIRLRDQILKSDLPQEQQIEGLKRLQGDAEAGLNAIDASPETRAAFQKEFVAGEAGINERVAAQAQQKLVTELNDYSNVINSTKQTTEQFEQAVENAGASLETAINRLGSLLPETFVADPSGQSGTFQENERTVALRNEFQAASNAFKSGQITFEEFSIIVDSLGKQVNDLAAVKGIQDPALQNELSRLQSQIDDAYLFRDVFLRQEHALNRLGGEINLLSNEISSLTNSISGARGFAKGGPVGTDTIPAWLSPGEYVVNAKATRENFNWLQAINYRGLRARGYATGGPVSTQSFSNTFNISSNNPNMQAGVLMNVMRRQIAQGKATLTKRRPY